MNGLRIKKAAAILLALVCALAFAGCGGAGQTSSDTALVGAKAEPEKEFKVEKFNLKFRTPADWKDDNKDTELDWYCGNDSVGMGIFGYYRSDFASGTNIIDILSQQSKDNTGRYINVQKVEHTPAFSSTDKKITTELYSAEYKESKIYQYFCYVEFKESDEFFWVTFSSQPSYMKKNFKMLESIIDSFEIEKGGEK